MSVVRINTYHYHRFIFDVVEECFRSGCADMGRCVEDTMKYNPDIHHRRSIRLREYDYSANGAYFVTICTQARECLFGDISAGEMHLNEAGRMVETWWQKLPTKFFAVSVDTHITMPNHFHGIIRIVGATPTWVPAFDFDVKTGATTRGLPLRFIKTGAASLGGKKWAPTRGCPYVGRCDGLVQDHDHQHVHKRRQTIWVDAISRAFMAAQLL